MVKNYHGFTTDRLDPVEDYSLVGKIKHTFQNHMKKYDPFLNTLGAKLLFWAIVAFMLYYIYAFFEQL